MKKQSLLIVFTAISMTGLFAPYAVHAYCLNLEGSKSNAGTACHACSTPYADNTACEYDESNCSDLTDCAKGKAPFFANPTIECEGRQSWHWTGHCVGGICHGDTHGSPTSPTTVNLIGGQSCLNPGS
jgi:hypothetical protein